MGQSARETHLIPKVQLQNNRHCSFEDISQYGAIFRLVEDTLDDVQSSCIECNSDSLLVLSISDASREHALDNSLHLVHVFLRWWD